MATIKSNDREWEFSVDINAARKVFPRFECELLDPERMSADVYGLIQSFDRSMSVIFALCKKEAIKDGDLKAKLAEAVESDPESEWTLEDIFWDQFSSQEILDAVGALRREITDFIRTVQPKYVKLLEATLLQAEQTAEAALEVSVESAEDPEMLSMMKMELRNSVKRLKQDALKSLSGGPQDSATSQSAT